MEIYPTTYTRDIKMKSKYHRDKRNISVTQRKGLCNRKVNLITNYKSGILYLPLAQYQIYDGNFAEVMYNYW